MVNKLVSTGLVDHPSWLILNTVTGSVEIDFCLAILVFSTISFEYIHLGTPKNTTQAGTRLLVIFTIQDDILKLRLPKKILTRMTIFSGRYYFKNI